MTAAGVPTLNAGSRATWRGAISALMVALAPIKAPADEPPGGGFPYGVLGLRGYPMEMREDGRFRIYSGTTTFAEGTFAIDGDRLTISDTGGRHACRGKRLNPGSYTWAVSGRGLRLSVIKDHCGARRTAFLEAPLEIGFTDQ